MNETAVSITATSALSEGEREEVTAIESASEEADGLSPLDDEVRLALEFGAEVTATHLVARWSLVGPIVGYAHLADRADGPPSAHLMVSPAERHRGVGTALLRRLLQEAAPQPVRVWSHGDLEAARRLSERVGLRRVRDLWKMTRSMSEPLPEPTYPPGLSMRTFEAGRDDEAWVTLNATAFSEHPEQGGMTLQDLQQRMSQPWFDPAGFFLAERDGALVGFHWTKVHEPGGASDERRGEVYVVGVHPDERGSGLGKALTLTGLHHLRDSGLGSVELYVEGDNTAAVSLYEGLGFTRTSVDVMYEYS